MACLRKILDQPFIGIFVLIFLLPLIQSKPQLFSVALKTLPLTLIGIVTFIFLATASGAVCFQGKSPDHFLRVVSNLVFVSIPEEAFYRGFVQEELFERFGEEFKGHVTAVFITSIFFALMQCWLVAS